MKDRTSRVLAIIALVFALIFVASLTATLVDINIFNGGIGYIALCSGVFVLMIFIALKADGRGYSLSKMRNESEMKRIEDALKAQEDGDAENKSDGEVGERTDVEPEPNDGVGEKPDAVPENNNDDN